MALFRVKKEEAEEKKVVDTASAPEKKTAKATTKKEATAPKLEVNRDLDAVLARPRVTEKATLEIENGVYVFNISPRATKSDVAEAIQAFYKVTPRKVNIVNIPTKKVRVRGSRNTFGTKAGGKKAYVYLKKGDTLDIA